MKLSKIAIIAAATIITLTGCEQKEDNRAYHDISVTEIKDNNQRLLFKWGIYSQCIDGNAYVVSAGRNTTITQVLDSGNPVTCLIGKENYTVRHQNPDRGSYKICIGGYSFIAIAEKDNINVTQVFSNNQKATICVPNKENLHKDIFVHPEIHQKMKLMDNLFNLEDKDVNSSKSNQIH